MQAAFITNHTGIRGGDDDKTVQRWFIAMFVYLHDWTDEYIEDQLSLDGLRTATNALIEEYSQMAASIPPERDD